MKKVNNYFSHDYHARDDAKLKKLRMSMGMEGIGIYWCIIEFLYENNGYLLIEDDIEMLIYELRIDKEKLLKVIENFDLFKISKNKVFSQSVLNRLKKIEKISNDNREKVLKRWAKKKSDVYKNSNTENIQEQYTGITEKIQKKRKEKKKKENKKNIYNTTTNNNIFNFIEENFGRTISPLEYEKINSWLSLYNQEIIEYAIRIAVMNGKRTFNYVEGIFKNWKGKNLQSIQDITEDNLKLSTIKQSDNLEKIKEIELSDYNWIEED